MQATLAMPAVTQLLPLIPELVLVGAAFGLLMLDLFLKDKMCIRDRPTSPCGLAPWRW